MIDDIISHSSYLLSPALPTTAVKSKGPVFASFLTAYVFLSEKNTGRPGFSSGTAIIISHKENLQWAGSTFRTDMNKCID